MKVGISLSLWTAAPTLEEHGPLLPRLKSLGFDGVELHSRMMSEQQAQQLAKIADDAGLSCIPSVVMPANIADPASEYATLRAAAVDAIRRGVDKAVIFNSGILIGPMFQGLGRFTGSPPTEEELERVAEVFREVGAYAAQAGVRIAIEPLNRFEMYICNTAADGVRFCERIGLDNIGLLLDTHHANIEELDTAAAWTAAAQRVFYVHISENNRGVPGAGHAAPQSVFNALRSFNYDGWLTIEAFSGNVPQLTSRLHLWRRPFDGDEFDLAEQGLKYIRESWARAENATPAT